MVKQDNKEEKVNKIKNNKKDFIFAVGRRKEAVARVRLYQNTINGLTWNELPLNKGEIYVNEKPIGQYFSSKAEEATYREPLRITNTLNKYTLTIKVEGGGKSGQLEAVVLSIARVLEKVDREKFRPILKKRGFLTRDARIRERRKVGTGGKARREKQSPKR